MRFGMANLGGTLRCAASAGLTLAVVAGCEPASAVSLDVLQSVGLATARRGVARDVERLQMDLSWIGVHRGHINGNVDQATREAIRLFQRGLGDRESGELTSRQREKLARRAEATHRRARFRTELIDWVGVRIDLPQAYVTDFKVIGEELEDVVIQGRGAAGILTVLDRREGNFTTRDWTATLRRWAGEREYQVLASGYSGSVAYAVAQDNDRRAYWVYEVRGREARGLEINLDTDNVTSMRPLLARMIGSYEAFAGPGVPRAQIPARLLAGDFPGFEKQPDWYLSALSNGSGSIVSRDGHILTNHHVIAGCERLTVNGNDAFLVGSDVALDLAVLKSSQLIDREPVRFAARAIELGEPLMVFGYPVFDISPSLNVTTGVVSSSTGYRGDRTQIQISAPVQPGNSGGPVISRNGAQVGVVVTKIAANERAESNIENISYAVRSAEAAKFLESYGVRPLIANDAFEMPDEPRAEAVQIWRRVTVRVECHGQRRGMRAVQPKR